MSVDKEKITAELMAMALRECVYCRRDWRLLDNHYHEGSRGAVFQCASAKYHAFIARITGGEFDVKDSK